MSAGILDTSVFIAQELGRLVAVETLPEKGYVTVITWGELQTGILTSPRPELLALRLDTFEALSRLRLLEVDKAAAIKWAVIRSNLLAEKRRVNVNDLWIAAIAKSRDMPVYGRDGDFEVIMNHGGPEFIRV